MSKNQNTSTNVNIEDSLNKLSDIVQKLEKNETTLDESINMFDDGVKIANDCFKSLKSKQRKITQIKNKMNEFIEVAFDENEDD